MPDRFAPVNPKFPHMLHGADYNPDQWPREIWAEDVALMKRAHVNVVALAIFSWAQLEPQEQQYDFGWLDDVMDNLAANGVNVLLATPSAAHPAWMSARYPEVLVTGPDRVRRLHSVRNNFCYTSPAYRTLTAAMDRALAERYARHPALFGWHISNEYGNEHGSECHCEICQAEFRKWLKNKYGSLDAINAAWWTSFWGHTYSDWSEIDSPGRPYGEEIVHGLDLDWRRFVTDQMLGFMRNEISAVREFSDLPVTTNFMGAWPGLNYWKFAPHVDVVSWDSYPSYVDRDEMPRVALQVDFVHEIMRTMKGGRPFMLMEITPSSSNGRPFMKLKRPGVHRLQALQAVARGSDSVQYFQWRAGRGNVEQFHGAIIAHSGAPDTRVFREVAEVGAVLAELDDVVGTTVKPDAAILYDWENAWAISVADAPSRERKEYQPACLDHYKAFWSRGVPVDVVNMDCDFSKYKLLVAPMLYMLRPGVAERLERFVEAGGVLVTTYWSGIADENGLAFVGGRPGPLRRLLGVWSEEIDVLYDDERNSVISEPGNGAGLRGVYEARTFCDLVHPEGAKVLAVYGGEFYKGRAAVTVNEFGDGRAFYVASRNDERFMRDLLGGLADELGMRRALDADLPDGVAAAMRAGGGNEFVFLLNWRRDAKPVDLGDARFEDMLTGQTVTGLLEIPGYGSMVLKRL